MKALGGIYSELYDKGMDNEYGNGNANKQNFHNLCRYCRCFLTYEEAYFSNCHNLAKIFILYKGELKKNTGPK